MKVCRSQRAEVGLCSAAVMASGDRTLLTDRKCVFVLSANQSQRPGFTEVTL